MLHDLHIINYRSNKSVSINMINNNINIHNYIVVHDITMCIILDDYTHNNIVNSNIVNNNIVNNNIVNNDIVNNNIVNDDLSIGDN